MSVCKERNKRLRFTYDDDLVLLRDVVAHNPITNPEKWEIVEQNMERIVSKKFSKRTLKEHLQLLLEAWMKKDACKIRLGNEEPYSEKDILLQEISLLYHESQIKNKNKRSNISKERIMAELGKEAEPRESITSSLANEDCGVEYDNIEIEDVIMSDHDYYEPNRKMSNKNRTLKTLAYLNEKQDREYKIRSKELELEERRISIREMEVALEERKLCLQEEKHAIDILETRQKIELEKERFKLELSERKTTNALLESQQKIIDNLLKNFRS